jgi:hypothetical protein
MRSALCTNSLLAAIQSIYWSCIYICYLLCFATFSLAIQFNHVSRIEALAACLVLQPLLGSAATSGNDHPLLLLHQDISIYLCG